MGPWLAHRRRNIGNRQLQAHRMPELGQTASQLQRQKVGPALGIRKTGRQLDQMDQTDQVLRELRRTAIVFVERRRGTSPWNLFPNFQM
mmetsp:Transcript_32327/g.72970  ORF Transcript_32327/g.72970 Transcript_32327/m.72970 type:complete len:89 (-) Transcript_32327:377-643(-)